MFIFKALLLAVLLPVTDVCAARIYYSAKYTHSDNNDISRTSKSANVPDDKVDLIVTNMQIWANDKYTATNSRHNMITVANVEPAASKGKASEEVQDMQSIVSSNIQDDA